MSAYLFAYGTLRRGFENECARKIEHLFIGAGAVSGRVIQQGEFPGLIPEPGGGSRVAGEVFEIPDAAMWAELDEYEQPDYVRTRMPVQMHDGRTIQAFVYVLK